MTVAVSTRQKQAETALPKGWKLVRLKDVCILNPPRPRNLICSEDSLTTFVPMPSVDAILGEITKPEIKTFKEVKKGYTYFQNNDVLFAKITPCMQNGKHAIAKNLINNFGFGTTEFHVIRPTDEIISEWIYRFVRQPKILQEATEHFTGSVGQQRVPVAYLENLFIPLPPLEEQKRIVAILNEKMEAIAVARKATLAQIEAAEALPAAYLRQVFDSPEAQQWECKKLGDIAKTCSGATPSRKNKDYYNGTIPWIKTGELKDGKIIKGEEHVTEISLRETSIKLLPPGTLLVAMYGQGKTRGRTGIITIAATTNQACFAILPNSKLFNSEYLQLWFRNSYYRLRKETEGRGGNQPNLNGELLRDQLVQLPTLEKQKNIVVQINKAEEETQKLMNSLHEQLEAINALPATILRQAFNGEL
jgi:type I restriction enzyme S subunit